MEKKPNTDEVQEYIYRPYITVKGVRIYPKHGKCFKIPVNNKK